jgi:hypothetical protein
MVRRLDSSELRELPLLVLLTALAAVRRRDGVAGGHELSSPRVFEEHQHHDRRTLAGRQHGFAPTLVTYSALLFQSASTFFRISFAVSAQSQSRGDALDRDPGQRPSGQRGDTAGERACTCCML